MGKPVGLNLFSVLVSLLFTMSDVDAMNMDSIPRLPTVHIRSRGAGVHVRNDTVEYQAAAYRGPEVRKVQDLLARLEGFSVSADGRIHFNGQEIETILLNGEDMTGTNYRLLSKYLRAGLVKKVQVIHDHDPDLLMREVRRSGKIGISLVLYDSLSRSVSGGMDIGASVTGRKDMDLHLISLQGPSKAIALGQWNSTGETVTGNRDFYSREETQEQAFTAARDRTSPAKVGGIHPPSLPTSYVRDNDDASGSLIWKQKVGSGKQLGLTLGLDRTDLGLAQSRTSRYALPDGSSWTTSEQELVREVSTNDFLRAEYTEDRGRQGRGQFVLDLHGMFGQGAHADLISGAVKDDVHETEWMKRARILGRVRESWRLSKGVLLLDGAVLVQRERQTLSIAGHGLSAIGCDSGVAALDQYWRSREASQDILLKYLSLKQRRSGGWGLRYRGLQGHRSVSWALHDDHSGSVAFDIHAWTLEGDREWKLGRNARLQGNAMVGLGGWRIVHDGADRVTPLHDLYLGYQRQDGPFRGWSLVYRDARTLPEDEYVLPMDLASGRYTLISPQRSYAPSSLHQFSFDIHARNVAAGAGVMFQLRYSIREHDVLHALQMTPGATRIMPILTDRTDDIHANLSADLYVEPVRMKLSGDLHLTTRWEKALINSVWADRFMSNSGIGLRLASGWKGPVNVDAALSMDNNRYRDRSMTGTQVFSTWSGSLRMKTRVRWHARWYGALSAEWFTMPGLPSFVTSDIFVTWQCHERLSFSVTGHNLLDLKGSTTRWAAAGSEGETVFRVVPAYLVWKLSWGLG